MGALDINGAVLADNWIVLAVGYVGITNW